MPALHASHHFGLFSIHHHQSSCALRRWRPAANTTTHWGCGATQSITRGTEVTRLPKLVPLSVLPGNVFLPYVATPARSESFNGGVEFARSTRLFVTQSGAGWTAGRRTICWKQRLGVCSPLWLNKQESIPTVSTCSRYTGPSSRWSHFF